MTKKKQKRTELRVVKPLVTTGAEEHQEFPPLKDVGIWNLEEVTSKLKKARKRIKALENKLTAVGVSHDMLEEKHVALEKEVATLDTRTSRMGIALRACMKKLGVERPD